MSLSLTHKRTPIQSSHEQTVQMPSLVHGDLIKSISIQEYNGKSNLQQVLTSVISQHHSASPGTIFPRAAATQIWAFVYTMETSWIHLFTSMTYTQWIFCPWRLNNSETRVWHLMWTLVTLSMTGSAGPSHHVCVSTETLTKCILKDPFGESSLSIDACHFAVWLLFSCFASCFILYITIALLLLQQFSFCSS